MGVLARVKRDAAQVVVNKILSLLGKSSDANIIRLTKLAERIAATPHHKNQIKVIRNLFEAKHPGLQLAKKVLSQIHPNCRKKIVQNLFIETAWLGRRRRQEILEKEGFFPPFFMVISPTMRCNLRCYGCYAGSYSKDTDLPFDIFDRLICEGKELGMHFITISGGEPFVYESLLDIFKKHQDVVFQIYTNGTFIDGAMAKTLAELGNASPAISVEGLEEETDKRRGVGTFKKIMAAMDALREEGVLFGFSATYTRHNIDVLTSEEFINFYIEKGCSFGWFFNYIPIGREPNLGLMATPEQRDRMRRRALEIRRTKPIFVADFWNDGPLSRGCMAGGKLYLHINHRGDVEPCVFAHFAVDNIKEKSLKEALNSPFFKAIRQRQPFCQNDLRPCMIIDHPHILREVVAETGARATDGSDKILQGEIAEYLDNYTREYAKFAEPAWEEGYEWAKRPDLL